MYVSYIQGSVLGTAASVSTGEASRLDASHHLASVHMSAVLNHTHQG